VREFGGIEDVGCAIGLNLRECAVDQAADVGEDGSAASQDAALGGKSVELAQGMLNPMDVLECLRILDEDVQVIGGFLLFLIRVMLQTEVGMCVGHQQAAWTTAGIAMGAT
jgi:hypothetical protein